MNEDEYPGPGIAEPAPAPQASLTRPAPGPIYPAPTLMESLMTLALIGLVGYTCWVLYGPLIVQMFRDIWIVLIRH